MNPFEFNINFLEYVGIDPAAAAHALACWTVLGELRRAIRREDFRMARLQVDLLTGLLLGHQGIGRGW